MKRILLLSCFSVFTVFTSFSQCTPDFVYSSLGIPGVYPPAIQIPNLPVPTGIADGSLGFNYNQTITLVVLEDTTMDIASLLPASAVTAMTLAGISTVMSVDVNHVSFDVQGLPNGINSQCDISSCQYSSGNDGCIKLSGTPTVAGTFPVDVNMTINIQIPSIAGIVPSMAVDIPSFAAVTYDLLINDATSLQNTLLSTGIFPNPTSHNITIEIKTPKQLKMYDNLGKLVYHQEIDNSLKLNTSKFNRGVYIVELSDEYSVENHKLILQ